nr:hypothetical protein [Klebsiella pneumoniae]
SVHCGVLIVVVTYERGISRQRQPGAGLLFFYCRGGGERVLSRTAGAASFARRDAAPVCMVTMRLFFVTHRTFWQEMAWVLSAVFGARLGHCAFVYLRGDARRSHSSSK